MIVSRLIPHPIIFNRSGQAEGQRFSGVCGVNDKVKRVSPFTFFSGALSSERSSVWSLLAQACGSADDRQGCICVSVPGARYHSYACNVAPSSDLRVPAVLVS